MMASCLPVLELSTESNKLIYPKNVVKFAESSPKGISNAINELIENDDERNLIIKNAYDWVSILHGKRVSKSRTIIEMKSKNLIKTKIKQSMYERYKKIIMKIKITSNEIVWLQLLCQHLMGVLSSKSA